MKALCMLYTFPIELKLVLRLERLLHVLGAAIYCTNFEDQIRQTSDIRFLNEHQRLFLKLQLISILRLQVLHDYVHGTNSNFNNFISTLHMQISEYAFKTRFAGYALSPVIKQMMMRG